ncbi:MAG: HNH endonuclease [Bacteroidetes bacterium]|nr:HNH endonuclease [Bacteroidota bacterium]
MSAKETWKPIDLKRGKNAVQKYAISTHGRMSSYTDDLKKARILRVNNNGGFLQVNVRTDKKSRAVLIHRAVAEAFLKKPSPKHSFVLHLDYNKKNNHVSNLKWATRKEQIEHVKKSPYVIMSKKHRMVVGYHSKTLDAKKVEKLKQMIWDPERRKTLAQIARQFGVSEMNIYRIKSGEFWYHIHVEGEPIHPKYKEYLKNSEYHKKLREKEEKEQKKAAAERESRLKEKASKKKKNGSKSTKTGASTLAKLLKRKKKK